MPIVSVQKLENADKDADSLNKFVNGAETESVKTRLNVEYPTLANAVRQIMETGGFEPFATETALLASVPTVTKKAAKALDTKKVWYWNGTSWEDTGLSDLDLAKGYVDSNLFFKPRNVTTGSAEKDLNLFVDGGIYHITTSSVATPENNFPFRSGGVLIVVVQATIVRQVYLSAQGFAHRYAALSGGIASVWQSWIGVKNTEGIADLAEYLKLSGIETALTDYAKKGKPNHIIVTDISQLSGHLDNVVDDGTWQLNTGSIASLANGFPISGSGGFLTVKRNASAAIHQLWQTYNGYAFRWGGTSNGVFTWQPWRGFRNPTNSIIDISQQVVVKNLIVYGSSTLEYLFDEFTEMCIRRGLTFKDKALSGESLNGAGFVLGANDVTISFSSGQINSGSNTVLVTQAWSGRKIHKTTAIELSNGVKGNLSYASETDTYTLTVSNVSSTITGVSGVEFKAISPDWYNAYDGVLVINIGKNNVGYDSQEIILENTQKFLDYLPKNSKFVVVGHFHNTNALPTTISVVDAINDYLRKTYGLRYVDIIDLLMSDATWTELGLTKTQADLDAISNRQLPPSLSRDVGHLSPEMDVILAKAVENKMLQLGYI